jgi:hypothetical protein
MAIVTTATAPLFTKAKDYTSALGVVIISGNLHCLEVTLRLLHSTERLFSNHRCLIGPRLALPYEISL